MTEAITTNQAPEAAGPYSQGLILPESRSKLIFVSGQLPIDLETGRLLESDIYAMTHLVIDHIEAILIEGGSQLSKVLRVEVFLTDLAADFQEMNRAYGERFNRMPAPARQTIGVQALPLGSPLEISCIAV